MQKLELTTAPESEFITNAEAANHVFGDESADDAFLSLVVPAARKRAEQYTERAFINQSWTMTLDKFPEDGVIYLPKGKIQSVTSFGYTDTSNAAQTLTENTHFYMESTGDVARLIPEDSWPDLTEERQGNIQIVFVAGYGTSLTDEHAHIKLAVLQDIGLFYECRQSGSPFNIYENETYKMLLHREKIYFDFITNNS